MLRPDDDPTGREAPEDPPAPDREDTMALVFDFTQELLEDQERGAVRPLSEYLRRYPGADAEIAAEFLELTGEGRDVGAEVEEGAEDEDDGERRMGKYRLLRRLGAGGQGEVWLARDDALQRQVALKLLSALFITDDKLGRFRREAESIARLEHPGLAQVHDADMGASPPFIAMRFVDGVDLRASLAARREVLEGNGRIDTILPWVPARRQELIPVLRFFERAARALHAAHEAGVLHRDVKPGNIMVTPDGRPVLLDFGLARDGAEREGDVALTREGDVFGTLAYMAPEQLRGHAVGPGADVFGLGATMFEALTGELPVAGSNPAELAAAIASGQRRDPRDLNPALTRDVAVVLETALEPSVERRYRAALELAEDLRRIAEYEPIQARPPGLLLRFQRWCRRETRLALAIVGTLLALVAGLVAALILLHDIRTLYGENVAQQWIAEIPSVQEKTPAGALALGLYAVELEDGWRSRSALVSPLLDLTLGRQHRLSSPRPGELAFLDPTTFVLAGPGGEVSLRSAEFGPMEGQPPPPLVDVGSPARCVAVDPRTGSAVVGTLDGRVVVLDAGTLETRFELTLGKSNVTDVACRDGVAVVATFAEGVRAIDLARGDVVGSWTSDLAAKGVNVVRFAGGEGAPRVCATSRAFHGRAGAMDGVVVLAVPSLEELAVLGAGAAVRDMDVALAVPRAAAVNLRGEVRLFDLEALVELAPEGLGSGAPLFTLNRGKGASIAVAPDGGRLAVGADVEDVRRQEAARAGAYGADWSVDPEPEWAVVLVDVAGSPGATRAGAARVQAVRAVRGVRNAVDLAFSPDGTRVATAAGFSTAVHVIEAGTGEVLHEHRDLNRYTDVVWSPDGSAIASLGIKGTVDVYRDRQDHRAFRFGRLSPARGPSGAAPLVFAAFTASGERAVLCDAAGRAGLFETPEAKAAGSRDPAPGALVRTFHLPPPGPAPGEAPGTSRVAVASEAPLAVWCGRGGAHQVIATDTGATLAATAGRESIAELPRGFRGTPRDLAVTSLADARWRAAALDADGALYVLEESRAPVRVVGPSGETFELVELRPGTGEAFVCTAAGQVFRAVIDGGGATLAPLVTIAEADPGSPAVTQVRDLRLTPDGSRLALASNRYHVALWSLQDGTLEPRVGAPLMRRRVIPGPDGVIVSAARGPGSVEVILAGGPGGDGSVRPPVKHDGLIRAVALGPGGELAATAGEDGTVIVFRTRTGEMVQRPSVLGGPVRAIDVHGRGDAARILAAGEGGACLWPVGALELAKEVAPRLIGNYERSLPVEDAAAVLSGEQ